MLPDAALANSGMHDLALEHLLLGQWARYRPARLEVTFPGMVEGSAGSNWIDLEHTRALPISP